jgi:adenylate cyclase
MKKNTSRAGIFISLFWCVLALALLYRFPHFCDTINFKIYDWKLALTALPDRSPVIVHLDVDDAAITKIGQWPWGREMSGRIVRRLKELGARVVAFDVLYASSGRSEDGNRAFFDAIRDAGNVVSASAVSLTHDYKLQLITDKPPIRGDALYDKAWALTIPPGYTLWKVRSVQNKFLPLPEIIQYSREIGHIKGAQDSDGVHRRIRLLVVLEDRCIPSLTLATLAAYWNLTPKQITLSTQGTIDVHRDGQVNAIPVDSQGQMLIRWGDVWDGFPHFSAIDVLSEEPDQARESRYKDKIVIVAVTATGTTDMGVTPRSVDSPLSRIHSHALNTILTNSFMFSVPAFPWIVIFSAMITILFSFVAAGWRWKVGAIVGVVICVLVCVTSVVSFAAFSYDIPVTEFFLFFFPAAFVSLGIRGVTIERQAARVSRMMVRYLAPEVLERILESGEGLDISVKRMELTIVFVDMQGFSTISETVGVEYVHRFLNDFFQRMTQSIFDHHGTIDKFLGDGLLAFFGDPLPLDNHAEAAVRAAIDMQREMSKLNEEWALSGISELKNGVHIRIGINTGVVIVGDLGSGRRVEYTVVGSAVNIAARLQSHAPAGGIMMTARTRAMVRDKISCEGPDIIRVKGIDRDIEVYRIYPHSISV